MATEESTFLSKCWSLQIKKESSDTNYVLHHNCTDSTVHTSVSQCMHTAVTYNRGFQAVRPTSLRGLWGGWRVGGGTKGDTCCRNLQQKLHDSFMDLKLSPVWDRHTDMIHTVYRFSVSLSSMSITSKRPLIHFEINTKKCASGQGPWPEVSPSAGFYQIYRHSSWTWS